MNERNESLSLFTQTLHRYTKKILAAQCNSNLSDWSKQIKRRPSLLILHLILFSTCIDRDHRRAFLWLHLVSDCCCYYCFGCYYFDFG